MADKQPKSVPLVEGFTSPPAPYTKSTRPDVEVLRYGHSSPSAPVVRYVAPVVQGNSQTNNKGGKK
jgi:hypothetical protein